MTSAIFRIPITGVLEVVEEAEVEDDVEDAVDLGVELLDGKLCELDALRTDRLPMKLACSM